MNKIKIALVAFVAMGLGSCTVYHTAIVTNNPVGTKVGVATAKVGQVNADFGYQAAMKKGKITKVGIAETKVTFFFVGKGKTTVTGE